MVVVVLAVVVASNESNDAGESCIGLQLEVVLPSVVRMPRQLHSVLRKEDTQHRSPNQGRNAANTYSPGLV